MADHLLVPDAGANIHRGGQADWFLLGAAGADRLTDGRARVAAGQFVAEEEDGEGRLVGIR